MLTLGRRPRPGDELELRIDELNAEGLGCTSVQVAPGPFGQPLDYEVLVGRTLPGERVRVRVRGRRKRAIVAQVVAIEEASTQRQTARCPHFGEPTADTDAACGGCSLQSLTYTDQLELKQRTVQRLLATAGVEPSSVASVIPQSEPWYYRNKMEYSFRRGRRQSIVCGMHAVVDSRAIVPLGECYLLSPAASRLVPAIARWAADLALPPYDPSCNGGFLRSLIIREGKRTGELLVELLTTGQAQVETAGATESAAALASRFAQRVLEVLAASHTAASSVYWTQQHAVPGAPTQLVEHLLHGAAVLHEELHIEGRGVLRFEIHPRAFFQPNTSQAERLYAEVLRATAGAQRGETGSTALDLYCGTGTIALCLAPRFSRVIGIELQADAVANASRNATFNGIDNAIFHAGDVGAVLAREGLGRTQAVDVAIVDPPRSGLLPGAVAQIHQTGARRLVYVSCNPRALATDLSALRYYGFAVTRVQPVDMFPQTAHIECVVTLQR